MKGGPDKDFHECEVLTDR